VPAWTVAKNVEKCVCGICVTLLEENDDVDELLMEFEEEEVAGRDANELKSEAEEVKELECDADDCVM
jgi:hypothetical protein